MSTPRAPEPPSTTTSRRRRGLLLAAAILLGLYNGCAGHRQSRAVGGEFARGTVVWSPGFVVRALRAAGTDDGDISRYFAYGNAILGRPYQGYYVRSLAGWNRDESDADAGALDVNDPALVPPVVPAAPLRPYRDFAVEYPPGFFVVALPPLLVARDLDTYRLLISSLMAACLLLGLGLCLDLGRRLGAGEALLGRLPGLTAMAMLAVGTIVVRRYDALISLCLLGSLWGVVARRPIWGGLALGLGVAAKGLPLLVVPLLLVRWLVEGRRREALLALGAATAVGLAVLIPTIGVAGSRIVEALAYHGGRPLQVESTFGALLAALRALDPGAARTVSNYGSLNVVGPWEPALRSVAAALPLLIAVAIPGGLFMALRRSRDTASRDRLLLVATVALLVGYMVTGKVFSPQYLTWILPLALLLALLDGRGAVGVLLVALLLTQFIFPYLYNLGLTKGPDPAFGAVALLRNLAVGAFAARLVQRALRSAPPATVGS